MQAMLLAGSGASADIFMRRALGDTGGNDEKWLQDTIFRNPGLLPFSDIDPDAQSFVPICRELALPGASGTIFLDIFGMTATGRPVLIECKLWRNPQARREVVGQILEYAALLRRWSYSDLESRLKRAANWSGANPLFAYMTKHRPISGEAQFVDSVSRTLRHGDFTLVIAGDGIRSDVHAVARLLETRGGLLAKFGLVEIQLWSSADGRTLVVPSVPLRTEVVRHRVLLTEDGTPVETAEETDDAESAGPPKAGTRDAGRAENRRFWQRFIDEVAFDYPDQPRPRHGTNNTVRVDLPRPATWMTVYRAKDGQLGLFFKLPGEEGGRAFDILRSQADAIAEETGLDLEWRPPEDGAPAYVLGAVMAEAVPQLATENGQLAWLKAKTNAMLNAFRPRLAQISPELRL